jgi:hypothetical protein
MRSIFKEGEPGFIQHGLRLLGGRLPFTSNGEKQNATDYKTSIFVG